ncbi:MAG: glycoside hydrolase family 43 protein, partial [Eubacterium sp.]|nr:glycoside hydrolase family 43 protein [Eubacterium sp.]
MIDDDGNHYLVYHQRFNEGNEGHELRVRRQYFNEDNWLVPAAYEYQGEEIGHYNDSEVLGTYEIINNGIATDGNMISPSYVTLYEDGSVKGDIYGTWTKTSGDDYDYLTITDTENTVVYKGYFYEQYYEDVDYDASDDEAHMTFAMIGNDNTTVWGRKVVGYDCQTLRGTAWWEGMEVGSDLAIQDGETVSYRICADNLVDDYGAFTVELYSASNSSGETAACYITTNSNQEGWFGGDGSGTCNITDNSTEACFLEEDAVYLVNVTRSGQDFVIEYVEEDSGDVLVEFEMT